MFHDAKKRPPEGGLKKTVTGKCLIRAHLVSQLDAEDQRRGNAGRLSEVFPFAVSKYLKHRYLIKDFVDEASHDQILGSIGPGAPKV